MQSLELSQRPVVLPEKQRAALISLLVDDDPAIYQMVRGQLLSYGQAGCQWLLPHTLSGNPVMRRRASEIVNHHARQAADKRFLDFCRSHGEVIDLEHATGLLAQTKYPEINLEAYEALYDSWAGELRARIDFNGPANSILGAINQFLFEDLGFSGNDNYGHEPESCYLNRIVDLRSGNPIGLCAIYLFITRRLRLPVAGIGLPGHFICRHQSSTQEIYIDAFRKGLFLSKADCVKYLLQTNHDLLGGHLSPVSGRRILLRMCHNLLTTYGHLELTEDAKRVQRYIMALSK